ncbi:hypothetical protein [Clostridium sp. Marseille-P2415]|uniref:hypothetical protein n=1 Tax=Clostridium sp. Marseille-P2415 TaxID=1805471 RepID=UPI00098885D6|nr:hypothetical protein [Clostridium sp. Marseille-P2415]
MKLKKLLLVPLVTFLLPMNCLAASTSATPAEEDSSMYQIIMPQFVYTNDTHLALDLSGNSATCLVKIVGYENVTKISGTMTLYKQQSNGSKTKISSWSLSSNGKILQSEKNASLSGSGKYVLTFSGKVYAGSKSETVSLTTTKTN